MPLIPHWSVLNTAQEIVSGDDCKAADGRGLSWSSPRWPDLAGATLTMVVGHHTLQPLSGSLPVTWTGAVPSSPSSPFTVFLDVAAAQTGVLTAGTYYYTLAAVLPSGDKITLAVGNLTVQAPPTTS
jgi:hypothetical protein